MKIEWKRIQNGLFEAYVNDKKSEWTIVNGSIGLSGKNTTNLYVPVKNGEIKFFKLGMGTTLAGAKDLVKKAIQRGL